MERLLKQLEDLQKPPTSEEKGMTSIPLIVIDDKLTIYKKNKVVLYGKGAGTVALLKRLLAKYIDVVGIYVEKTKETTLYGVQVIGRYNLKNGQNVPTTV